MRSRLAAALFACLGLVASADSARAASELPLVTASDRCPAKAGCIVVDIAVPDKHDPNRVIGTTKTQCGGKIVRVQGRLRGSAVRSYRLALQGSCLGPCVDGRAAYYGRSARNAPVIATDLGRFEIVDRGVEVGAPNDLLVIDEAKGTATQYIGNYAGSGDYAVATSRVYLRQGNSCVTAPQARAGFLSRVPPQYCRAPSSEAAAVDYDQLATGSRIFLSRLFVQQRFERSAEEIVQGRMRRQSGLILIRPNANCYAAWLDEMD